MARIPFDEFLTFVGTLDGETITTRSGKSRFTVQVVGDDIHFTPRSTGKPRQHTRPYVERVLQHFHETGSRSNADYKFTFNAAYQLTVIGRYLDAKNEDRRKLKMDLDENHDDEEGHRFSLNTSAVVESKPFGL